MLKLDVQTILEDEYTAKEVTKIFSHLDLLHKSPFAWLNWLKNSHEIFELHGSSRERREHREVDNFSLTKVVISKYTFADICLAVWARSVSSGNVRQTSQGGLAMMSADVIELAPSVLKQVERIQKKYETAVKGGNFHDYLASSNFGWNELSVNCLLLSETVVNTIVALEKRNVIVRIKK